MKPREFYSETADVYDIRHENPTMKRLRKLEGKAVKRFSRGLVLDAGCGTGAWIDHADMGMDISRDMLRLCRNEKPVFVSRNETIPFSEKRFDTVLCMFSVLNVCDHEKTVREFARILKPGGRVILSAGSVWDKNYSLREKLRLNRRDSDGKVVKTGSYKKFHVSGRHTRMRLFRKDELIELFVRRGFQPEFFDSLFILQKPRWNNFRSFSLFEKMKLAIERFLPYKDFGSFYVMVFRKR